jgi:hypothetical protein
MLHSLTIGHLDPDAIRDRVVVAVRPLDRAVVERLLAEFGERDRDGHWTLGRGRVEIRDGYVVVPWHGKGPVGPSEEFALRMYRETGCLIADRTHARIVEPGKLAGMAKVGEELTS